MILYPCPTFLIESEFVMQAHEFYIQEKWCTAMYFNIVPYAILKPWQWRRMIGSKDQYVKHQSHCKYVFGCKDELRTAKCLEFYKNQRLVFILRFTKKSISGQTPCLVLNHKFNENKLHRRKRWKSYSKSTKRKVQGYKRLMLHRCPTYSLDTDYDMQVHDFVHEKSSTFHLIIPWFSCNYSCHVFCNQLRNEVNI